MAQAASWINLRISLKHKCHKQAAKGFALASGKKDFWHRNLSVGHILAEDHVGYFRNGESNPGLQGENLLS